ncbi:MAG: hypothetical protein ABSD44_00200 [Terracidiphilus sp.]
MKPSYTLLAMLFAVSAAARAQVEPAATDAAALLAGGTLHYDLRYSQTAQFYGGPEGDLQRSVVSGEVAYSGSKEALPFNLTYSGGDMWTISGTSEGSGVFQHLLVSQGFLRRKWSFTVSDNVSYLPQAATTGFSGIPGVGILPGSPGEPTQPILTLNTRSINNAVSPDFTYNLDYATKVSIGGSYGILRFPDGNGLEVDSMQVAPQVERRLDALNSLTGQYVFSRFTYTQFAFAMETQSALFGYQRTWSRRFKTTFALGPEWVRSSDSAAIPSSTHLTANANASYEARSTTVTLSYSQASTGGAGVTTEPGTHIQDVNGAFSRQFGRNLTITATGTYMRTQGLLNGGSINGVFGGVAATRQLGRYISVFANYTAIKQSSSAALPTNAISGLSQVAAFGVGYSPREIHLKK